MVTVKHVQVIVKQYDLAYSRGTKAAPVGAFTQAFQTKNYSALDRHQDRVFPAFIKMGDRDNPF